MALFLRRLAGLAGVTVTDDPAHNTFSDIGAYTAEIQAAINFLADGHIALGTGGSLFSGNDPVLRWQMALFLTRVLAADGIVQPGSRVAITPTASATQGTGTARTYVVTFKNADGTAYTGRVGIQLLEATDGGAPIYNDQADFVIVEAVSDGLLPGILPNSWVGVAGSDGVVTFTIRHGGTAEDTIPLAWEDLNLDGDYESTGNIAPNEPFGLGGETDFASGPLAECTDATGDGAFAVTKTEKSADRYEANGCSLFYDSNDVFQVDGAAASLQEFEDALSVTDVVTSLYDPDTADQSSFMLADGVTLIAVTDPAVGGVTVDAATYAIKGTGDPGATVRIRNDVAPAGLPRGAEDGIAATGTVDADGNWTVTVPLAQGVANEFLASQVPVGSTEQASVDVPTINESASAGATFDGILVLVTNGNTILDPGDTIQLNFSENIAGVDGSDTITVVDVDGSSAVITRGLNSTWTVAGDLLTIAINAVLPASGGTTGGINNTATVTAVGGFTDDDGEAINVTANPANRTFSGF
jgi:hypothetical protein